MLFRIISAEKSVLYGVLKRHIMTNEARMQKVMEDLQKNPYYEKYSKKISVLQKTSPEEFVERIEKKVKDQKPDNLKNAERRYAPVLNPKAPLSGEASSSRKKLEDVLKMDLILDKSGDEIADIWKKYHSQKDVIAASIPADVYKKMRERISQYPTFLFPLPRSQGYEFIMSQTLGDSVHFTTLLCFQVHKENAPECLTMVHYTELMETKGIVLMKGDYDLNVINSTEAQCLANQFQLYYGLNDEKKLKLLEDFTKRPDTFKHMDLISETENMSIT